jgi:phosphate starvation-inducible PhoH-like protein
VREQNGKHSTRGAVQSTDDSRYPYRGTLTIDEPRVLRELVGELNGHLKIIERVLSVRVSQRGDQLIVLGGSEAISTALVVLEQLCELACTGHQLHSADVDQAVRLLSNEPDVRLSELYSDTVYVGTKKKRIHPRSLRQRDYIKAMRDHPLVFGVGPAGTGKTYLAMAMAVSALFRDEVKRIILCRPAVEAGEKLGFLPGDLVAKVNPYLRPLYDALYDLVGHDRSIRLIEKTVIEVAPLAFMRGRTLSGAYVILDEAQNTTPEQMKMFLTRIGVDSRVVVTGDTTQIDLPRGRQSGLVDALRVLKGLPESRVVQFSPIDVVRHSLVSSIIKAYDRDSSRRQSWKEQARGPDGEE